MIADAPIGRVNASAFTIPTDAPEADGTIAWDSTTLVVVEVEAGGKKGLGYTYADASLTSLIEGLLAKHVAGLDALDLPKAWAAMQRAVRNLGRDGLAATAIAAVDAALWDLKAKQLDLPLASLLGRVRQTVPVYGSGGFTTYDQHRLTKQLSGWVDQGCRWVKMKIGSHPEDDLQRTEWARDAVGATPLFVDANGAYSARQAMHFAQDCVKLGVEWFEEPVSSDDLEGLHFVRTHTPPAIDIAAGEYGYNAMYFRRMLAAQAVDVLQADTSRCGITGFLETGAICQAFGIDLSGHCAPALHCHVATSVPRLRHLEWFHDHVRIEHMLFDGAPMIRDGAIAPDLSRPGLGLEFKRADAAKYAA